VVFAGTSSSKAGTGQTMDFIATDILRVRDGKVTDHWHLEDKLTFF
jgi:predicted SnoaL-like aldol condensation-catalyzing enzyme